MFDRIKNIFRVCQITRLVGHNRVMYYNYETNTWNRNKYNGHRIHTHQQTDTKRALEFKAAMEHEPVFSAQYEMTTSVIMTIDSKFYPGQGRPINNPKHSAKGTAVVGNIIVKNKTTGKYELYCKSWIGVDNCQNAGFAVYIGASWFAYCGTNLPNFRAALIAAHTR